METNAIAPVLASVVKTTTTQSIVTLPPSLPVPSIATAPPLPVLPTYAKPFPDISRIEVFCGQNYKRWQERIYSTLDMHGVAWLLSTEDTIPNSEAWTYANKVCRHTILTTLSNELFDVYCAYKEAKVIWESMLKKYTTCDAPSWGTDTTYCNAHFWSDQIGWCELDPRCYVTTNFYLL